MDKILW